MKQTKRLFIAIKVTPSDDLLEFFEELKVTLSDEKIKWVSTKGIHITLKFLGDTDVNKIGKINTALSEVADNFHSFAAELSSAGVFPKMHDPKVIWAGINKAEPLTELQKRVEVATGNLGFPLETRAFKPHLTIARVNRISGTAILKQIIDDHRETVFQPLNVNSFHLFESQLHPQGPIYTILENFALK